MRYGHDRKILLISNWKCGSQTMEKMFHEYAGFNRDEFGIDWMTCVHWPAWKIRQRFDVIGWNWTDYRTITTVRNPWARMVSLFEHHKAKTRIPAEMPFDFYIDHFLHYWKSGRGVWNPKFWITEEMISTGSGTVHHVLPIEQLEALLPPIMDKYFPGVNVDCSLHLHQRDHAPYQDYYGSRSQRLVADMFTYDIEEFGYEFS